MCVIVRLAAMNGNNCTSFSYERKNVFRERDDTENHSRDAR